MAKRRCISIDFYDSEEFCDLPPKIKHLYTELILHCDDDGVVINPKVALRMCKVGAKCIDLLVNKKLLLKIDGVYVVRHWYVHNSIQPSKKIGSIYTEQLSQLTVNDSKEYILKSDLSDFCPEKIRYNINITEHNSREDNINKFIGSEFNESKENESKGNEIKITEAPRSANVPTQEELCNMNEYEEYLADLERRNSMKNSVNYKGKRRGFTKYR